MFYLSTLHFKKEKELPTFDIDVDPLKDVEEVDTKVVTENQAEEEFKTYNDYLSHQIRTNMEKGVDYTKANDLQKKELAKNYATVAASQKNKMENTPKNDKEAEDYFNSALANELLSKDSEKAATAQKNIDEIRKFYEI